MKTYDIKCYRLAEDFLLDSTAETRAIPWLRDLLAKEIQQTIEDFLEERKLT